MAVLIDHTNFAQYLKESTNAAGSSPNGNVYFDVSGAAIVIQLIGADELATFDHTSIGGGATDPNQLTQFDGITMRALYNFENSRRRANETLRKYKRAIKGSYRFAGAFNFVNGCKLRSTGKNDRAKIRGSGWIEYAETNGGETDVDRIYHGINSLVDIQSGTQPYYALVTATDEATLQAATWNNFARAGDINEAIQVFGSTANGDTGAGSFDYKTRKAVVRVRSWQYNPGETTSVATGISEFSGFSAGYGVGESQNPANTYTLANVFGGSAVAPFSTMTLEKLGSPQTETGFSDGSGNFTWVLNNPAGGTVAECAAYLDALTLQDADVDAGTGSYNGRKGRVWYTRNAAGKVVTNGGSEFGNAGLFIENLSAVEKQKVIFTADNGASKSYPFYPSVEIDVGSVAVSDTDAWIRVMYNEGSGVFDTANAITVRDKLGTAVNYNVNTCPLRSGTKIAFEFDYVNDNDGGLANTDRDCVVLVEGDGVAAQAIATFIIKNQAVNSVTCAPALDNNA